METQTIKIAREDKNLDIKEILVKNNIVTTNSFDGLLPATAIINKVRPNFGATYSEIKAHRHSIIIEPFIDVMLVKKMKHDQLICIIYEETNDDDITRYLNDKTIEFKKLITTPESFSRMIVQLKRFDSHYRTNYFLLYDECEQIVVNSLFRKALLVPLKEFFLFTNRSLISATPLIPTDKRFEKEGFKIITFKPDFDYRKNLKLICTNNLRSSIRNQFELYNDEKPVFIFTNCTDSILYATRLDIVKDDYTVFCAKDLGDKFFSKQEVNNIEHTVKHQKYAKYNFFTSRFFSAVDMDLPKGIAPHIIMITNIPRIKHSIIDPSTEAIQIWGRLRAGVSSITHITKLFYSRDLLSEREIENELNFGIKTIERLNMAGLDFQNNDVKTVIDAICDHNLYNIIHDDDKDLVSYYRDSYLHRLKTENKYVSIEALVKAYEESGFFKVNLRVVKHPISDEDKLHVKKISVKGRRMDLVNELYSIMDTYTCLDAPFDSEFIDKIIQTRTNDEFTYNLLLLAGFDGIKKTRFGLKHMKELYFDLTLEKRSNDYSNMLDAIMLNFKLDQKIFTSDLKLKLQQLYDDHSYMSHLDKKRVAKAIDILNYFEGKKIEPKRPHKIRKYETYYILTKPKYGISIDLKLLA